MPGVLNVTLSYTGAIAINSTARSTLDALRLVGNFANSTHTSRGGGVHTSRGAGPASILSSTFRSVIQLRV